MFCNKCGKELADNMNFCAGCGTQIEKSADNTVVLQPGSLNAQTAHGPTGMTVDKSAGTTQYSGSPAQTFDQRSINAGLPMQKAQAYSPIDKPVGQINTNRGLLKLILLNIVTLGIYAIVFFCGISNDINVIASRYDGRKTMHYALLFFLIGPITLGIAYFVWFHKLSNRIGGELKRRGVDYSISASDYWLWGILGALILIGPFLYAYKLCTACNKLAEHYNING